MLLVCSNLLIDVLHITAGPAGTTFTGCVLATCWVPSSWSHINLSGFTNNAGLLSSLQAQLPQAVRGHQLGAVCVEIQQT
jgi:hypothetical protein